MTYVILLFLIVLISGCGDAPATEEVIDACAVRMDTLHAVDSIGVLMGDSNYVLGAIADFVTLPGGSPAILDRVKGTVSVFDSTGAFLYRFGGFGEGPGEFQHPFRLTRLNSGLFVVAEMMGNITTLDAQGQYLASWKIDGMGGLPLDCIPFDDSTFVCYYFTMKLEDAGFVVNYSLVRYDAFTGETKTTYFDWSGDPNPATDFSPAYLVAAGDGNGNLLVSRVESPVWRVEVYGREPEPMDTVFAFPDRQRIEAPDTSMVPGVSPIRYAFSDGENETQQEMVNMPGEHPFISQLGMDGEGNLWCRRGGLPGDVWDVVSPDGELLREVKVALPDSAYYIDIDVSPHGVLAFDMFTEDFHKLYVMR